MGLDMILEAHARASKEEEKAIVDLLGIRDFIDNQDFPGLEVKVDCIYWRKVNAVHNWFVKNAQDGNDDCGTYYVDPDALEELRDACKEVLESDDREAAAEELLPTTPGFFYGSTDYDEWYFKGLEHTVASLDRVLKIWEEQKDRCITFYYTSSW